MQDASQLDEFPANQKQYDNVRNTLAGVEFPDPSGVDTQAMKPHYDWEKGRFNSLQEYVEASFKYLAEYNDQFVRLAQGRSNSLNVREAELQNILDELRTCEQRLDQLQDEKPEEEKDVGVIFASDLLDKDPWQVAQDQKKKKDSLMYGIKDAKDERINHVNMKIGVVQLKSAQKEVASKKHVEEVHDTVFRALIQSIFNRKFTDKSEVKKNFKDDRYIRHVMLRRNASTLSADIVTDMEEAIKAASSLEKVPEFITHFVKFLELLVREAKDVKELKLLEREIYKERHRTTVKLAEPAKYNYTDVQDLRTKIRKSIDYIKGIIEDSQIQKDNSDLLVQQMQQVVDKLKDQYAEVQYDHNNAQDMKRAPKERSLSKIPIQNQRSSLVTEEEGGEPSVTADIRFEGPQKSKKSGGFFACCGFS